MSRKNIVAVSNLGIDFTELNRIVQAVIITYKVTALRIKFVSDDSEHFQDYEHDHRSYEGAIVSAHIRRQMIKLGQRFKDMVADKKMSFCIDLNSTGKGLQYDFFVEDQGENLQITKPLQKSTTFQLN